MLLLTLRTSHLTSHLTTRRKSVVSMYVCNNYYADSSESCLVSLQRMVEGVVLEVHITNTLPFPSDMATGDATLTSSAAADSAVASLSLCTPVSSELEETATELKNMNVLSPLAPYIPTVELYTQLGAQVCAGREEGGGCLKPCTPGFVFISELSFPQTPTFINRELVELGFASWKEETAKEIKLS